MARRLSSSSAVLSVIVLVLWGLFMVGCSGDEQAWGTPPEPPVVVSAVAHGGPPAAMPAELRAAYIAAVQAQAAEAYGVQAAGTTRLRASNPAQGILSSFEASGVRVELRGAESEGLVMRLSRYGCAGSLGPVEQTTPTAEGNRVHYRRPHAAGLEPLVEWYVNGPLGLEQGFTLPSSPCGEEGGTVELELALAGGLVATELTPGRELVFHDRTGRAALHYGELYVKDARGRATPAQLSLGDGRVTLRIHDKEAAYPVQVDPLVWAQQAKLLAAGGAADDQFGFSVAISGDTAVIGVNKDDESGLDSGSVRVFVRSGGAWTEQAKLLASDSAAGDIFGTSVAISGDTAVIGADTSLDMGSAYVFVRSGGAWTEQAKLLAADGQPMDHFGLSVAISGDTVVVGAPNDNIMFSAVGSAYVFVRSGNVWTQQAKLVDADGAADDRFGYSVAVSGDTAVVGVPFDDDVFDAAGSAYVFVRSGNVWTQQAKLSAIDGLFFDTFGNAVAISGDTVVIGARTSGAQFADQGSAYVFVRSGNVWTQQVRLFAADAADSDCLGHSVALSGDTAVIGAYGDDDKGANSGSAYVFVRSGNVWTQKAKLLATDGAAGDLFGGSVAVDGSTAVIGAYMDSDNGAGSGSAYVFTTLLTNGSLCSLNIDCVSGFCVDGYCCNTACGGGDPSDCQACNRPNFKGSCGSLSNGTICRAAASVCDAPEMCSGPSVLCPPDSLAPQGTICRPGVDLCDQPESCTGVSNACPADDWKPAGAVCRAPAGVCDEAETCTGASPSCPVNAFKPANTLCRAAADVCDEPDNCNGAAAVCPFDALKPANTLCRAAIDVCDQPESCTGGSAACPADTLLPGGSPCRAASGMCDLAETCDGLAPICPADLVADSTVTCRPAADICDLSETCDGAGKDCPSDGFAAGGVMCRAPLGLCDVEETCTGQSAACPLDGLQAPGTECRASMGECDSSEECDGLGTSCPQDGYLPNGAPCSGGVCSDGACELGSGGAGGASGVGGSGAGGGSGTGGSGTGGSEAGGSGTGGGAGSGGVGGSGAAGAAGGAGGDGGPGGQAAETSGNGGDRSVDPKQEGGCDCRAAGVSPSDGASSSAIAGVLMLVLAAVRRARRRPRGSAGGLSHFTPVLPHPLRVAYYGVKRT